MPKRMRAKSSSLVELITSHARFSVPGHQRAYAWGLIEIERLLADLIAASGRFEAADSQAKALFLGVVYLSPIDDGAEIADGQQRFTTAMIILSALRDLAPTDARRVQLAALVAGTDGPRLKLAERDAAFFARFVQAPGATLIAFATGQPAEAADADNNEAAELSESQSNIIANRDAIVARLQSLGADGCQRLAELLEHGTELIVITAPTLDEARQAHASTHRRGLMPTEVDQLKAELIGDLPRGPRQELGHVWDSAEARTGKLGLEELMEHLITIEGELKPGHDIQGELFKYFRLPAETRAFVTGVLAPGAISYEQLTGARWAPEARLGRVTADGRRISRINGHLVSLARVTHSAWQAPTILALQKWALEPVRLEAALAGIERMAATYMIVGEEPNQVFEGYLRVVRELKSKPARTERALELPASLRSRAREVLEQAKFGTRDRCRNAVLLKLNDLLAGEVIAAKSGMTCEHVLPQNPARDSRWRQLFRSGKGGYNGHIYCQRIGNLAWLSYDENVRADRHEFAVKRPILQNCAHAHALTRDAAREREWTPAVIDRRSERLIKLLVGHWQL